MDFESPLIPGRLLKRYQRFLVDVALEEGPIVTAHCANSGSLLTLKSPGSQVWLSEVPPHKERKLRYDWQLIETVTGTLVSINTSLPNTVVAEALIHQKIPELKEYSSFKREVKYGTNSRIDFLLEAPHLPPCYLEIKSVTHQEGEAVLFPDSVTSRGAKHLEELMAIRAQGARAVVLYVIPRQDAAYFKVAAHIDPLYATLMAKALQKGVEFLCYTCNVSLTGINLATPLEIK